ncbi:hypothetical protein AAFF_G00412520 [Aldrovandia affinis]|uniref:Uncharacterized protein n=1 Tax=Aldrovandia affinis TaxID=143900 RepID=A0AAD7SAY1_9TELE|nr:hypothetical protein AAFF_G00412520 [Aldrovandia affinis]
MGLRCKRRSLFVKCERRTHEERRFAPDPAPHWARTQTLQDGPEVPVSYRPAPALAPGSRPPHVISSCRGPLKTAQRSENPATHLYGQPDADISF